MTLQLIDTPLSQTAILRTLTSTCYLLHCSDALTLFLTQLVEINAVWGLSSSTFGFQHSFRNSPIIVHLHVSFLQNELVTCKVH